MEKYQQADVDYLVTHKVPDIVDKLIHDLLEKKPSDPLAFMANMLSELANTGAKKSVFC